MCWAKKSLSEPLTVWIVSLGLLLEATRSVAVRERETLPQNGPDKEGRGADRGRNKAFF